MSTTHRVESESHNHFAHFAIKFCLHDGFGFPRRSCCAAAASVALVQICSTQDVQHNCARAIESIAVSRARWRAVGAPARKRLLYLARGGSDRME